MTLNDARDYLARKQAREAEERAKPLFPRLSREERAAQVKKNSEEGHARNMLWNGLEYIREGKPPTKAQMPYVQRYFQEHEEKLKEAKKVTSDAESDARYWEQLYCSIVPMWNDVCDAIRAFGIEYFGTEGNHGWRCKVGGLVEERRGYATEADALKAAIAWRLEMAKKEQG